MTDTTYPDGPYLFTGTDALNRKHTNKLVMIDADAIVFTGASYWCAVTDCRIESLTPLVPKTGPTMEEMILSIAARTRGMLKLRIDVDADGRTTLHWREMSGNPMYPVAYQEAHGSAPSEAVRAAWEAVTGGKS
jgi:hypothetical protein